MYRVIIVEDEMLVRMGLKNSIDWNRFNMCVIADADDGITAYELYEKEKPDLIITDLKMPGMSGMDLIARIRERDKSTKIIILTCLEEFELVRKAIAMGVSDYILKLTMTLEQINAVLARICEELSLNKNMQASYDISETNVNIIKEKIIKDFILYGIYNEKEFISLAKKYDFRFRSDKMILCILEMDHYNKIKSLFKDENGRMIKHTMLNMLKEMLINFGNGEVIYDDEAKFIVIFGYDQITDKEKIMDETFSILKEIETPVRTYFNTTVSFGFSDIQSEYSFLRKMYDQASVSLENKFFGGTGIYGVHVEFNMNRIKTEKTEEMLQLCERIACNSEGFFNEFCERVRSIMNGERHSRAEYLEMFCQLVQWTANTLKFQENGSEQIILTAIQSVQQSETLDDILRYLYEFLSRVWAVKRKKKITCKEVKLAMDFMESNYSKDLSLQQVSTYVSLSSSYLSSLFKKEIDVNFVEYLNEIRIEKAKELLLETYLKTYEIAESVGFNENTYFCKIFKKVSGKTPSEYRKQWLKKWTEDSDDEAKRQ